MRPAAIVLLVWWTCLGAAGATTPRHPDELELGQIDYTFPHTDEAFLKSGIPVYLFENHDLPLLDVDIRLRMGTRFLPAEQFTACGLLGRLWRSGGTETLPPDSLDKRLAELDVTISASLATRFASVSVSLVSADMHEALPLWRDVLLHPGLEQERLERAKQQSLKDLQAINNDPFYLAYTRFSWLLYGEDYPEAISDTRESIEAVEREDLVRIHRRFVHPSNAIIGVSGDFQKDQLLAFLNDLLEGWASREALEPLRMDPWILHPSPGVYLLRSDDQQSQVRIGRIVRGLTQISPDYAAARIFDFALGYGRIFYRSRGEGLSYGATVMLTAGDEKSELHGFGSTRAETTAELLRAMSEEVDRVHTEPLSEEEMETSRAFIIGTYINASETARSVVSRKLDTIIRNRPSDYLDAHLERLKTATLDDMAEIADKYVSLEDSVVVLVIGNPDAFQTPLDSLGFGPVTELEPVVIGE